MVTVLMKPKIWLDSKGLLNAVKKASIKPLAQAALLVESEAKQSMRAGGGRKRIPSKPGRPPHVRTGNLRASISHGRELGGSWVIGPTRQVRYGKIHEFGGRHHPMRSFMRPALMRAKKSFVKFFKGSKIKFKAKKQ